ncbi:MAG: ComEC family competence protein [Bacteroidales bacterium]|jgi:competence protein ComEC|nr:ComEC family competence protein [Bacteroidales bacterium]
MNFSHYPVLKALLPYIFGVIFGFFLPINNLNLLFCIFWLFFCGIIAIVFRHKKSFFLHQTATIVILFSFFFAGYLSVSFHFHKNIDGLNLEKITQKQTWIAEIIELPLEREKSYKIIAKLYAINDTSYWITNKVVLYFQKDSVIKDYRVGDKLIIHTKLSFIKPPKNPYQFNYEKLMKRKGIYLTGYVGKQYVKKIEGIQTYSVKMYASYLQRFLSEKLVASGLSGGEFSVAAAILLGNDDTLEPELRTSYASAGVSHILCVSGMHVGIIFMILNFLLLPLGNSAKSNFIRNLLLLVSIWVYANITGLAPSVSRAAAMFTFVLVGKFLNRQSNIFHSLFASLFILLIINPLLLFEVGFQLSYLAVFGIVIFQKMIAQWFHPKTKIGNYIWNLASVSIAAQLTTFPIAVYYFGQFPNYFLLANLFIIPISFVTTVTGVATLVFSFNTFLSNCLGYLLSFEVKIMNEGIQFIEKFPGAVIANISIHFIQVILLYIIVLTFCIFKKNRWKKLVFSLLITFNIFLSIDIINNIKNEHHIEVVNYDIPKCSAIQFCYKKNAIFFSDSIYNEQDKRYQYSVKKHDIKKHIKNRFITCNEDFENDFLCKKGDYILFCDTIYFLRKNKNKPNDIKLIIYNHNFPN